MNKAYKAALLVMGLSISAFAADSVPVDTKGNFTFPTYAGSSTCNIDITTGTNAVLCTTGSGVILQVIASSVSPQDLLVLRDYGIANTTSSTRTVIAHSDIPGIYVYPRFTTGLSANVLTAPLAGGNWTIVYTKSVR